jgi:hypothetical protein
VHHLGHAEKQPEVLKLRGRTRGSLPQLFQQFGQDRLVLRERERVGIRYTQIDLIAGFQQAGIDPFIVHGSPVPAPHIFDKVAAIGLDYLSVTARDSAVEQHQVAVALPAYRKRSANDFDFALVPKRVTNDKTWESTCHM